jgi:hypothetical protein
MTLEVHADLIQGTDEWIAARCGLITASEMDRIVTPSGKPAKNDTSRKHLYELLAQRVTGYVEPHYISDDMLRGQEGEAVARDLYREHAPGPVHVCEVGFMVRQFEGFRIGYSPDALVDDDGLIEIKSPRQKRHVETILDGEMPADHMLQVQTGLLVSGRRWCDFVSYCGGLPLFVARIWPDPNVQTAILSAVAEAEALLSAMEREYREATRGLVPTERRVEQEMVI